MTDELRARLQAMSTPELVEILERRDAEQWRPEVFPLVEAILAERGVDRPTAVASAVALEPPDEDETLERVASLGSSLEANLCRMALQEAGIEAWLSTEHLGGIAPPLGVAVGLHVLVSSQRAAEAREVLAAVEAGAVEIPEESEICPRCSSPEAEHRRVTDRAMAVTAFLVTHVPLATGHWLWKCSQCGHEWE
jgi:hypothetical protein